jgi:RNA polymerase subunit RPABC4/transcription elongation factor Spt4
VKLRNCIECNSLVSPTATRCPSCNTSSVNGVVCHFCNGILKWSDSKLLMLRSLEHGVLCSYNFHPDCYKVYIPKSEDGRVNLQVTCPACNNYTASIKWSALERQSHYQFRPLEKRDPYVSDISSDCPKDYIGYNSFRIFNSKNPNGTDVSKGNNKVYLETCPNCGHSINFKWDRQDDPYAACYICEQLVEKNNAHIGKSTHKMGYQVWIHEGGCKTFYQKQIAKQNQKKLREVKTIAKKASLSIGFGILGVFIFIQLFTYWFIGIICFLIAYNIWQGNLKI